MKFKSRKEARKELRKTKKVKKHEFFLKHKAKVKEEANKTQGKKGNNNKSSNNNNAKVDKQSNVKTNLSSTKKANQSWESNIEKDSKTHKKKFAKNHKSQDKRKQFNTPQDRIEHDRQRERLEREKLNRDIEKARIERLKADNEREEIEIKKLEKQMKMKKGKSKAFVLDGLDYLLDVCDKKISENEFEKALHESDSDMDSDFDTIKVKSTKKLSKKRKLSESETEEGFDFTDNNDNSLDEDENSTNGEQDVYDESLDDCSSDGGDSDEKPIEKKLKNSITVLAKNKNKKVKFENVESGEENLESEFFDDDDDDANDDTENSKNKYEDSEEVKKLWQDIYGRTRDESGNVVNTYVPPHLRKTRGNVDEKKNETLLKLRRQLKGLLNRLAESNMAYISNQVEQLYMGNSRNDMNETIFNLFRDSLFTEILTSERMIIEHAMLVAVLHSNIGSEIGAYFLQHSVTEFKKALEQDYLSVENKDINNILTFIMHLYNFQLFNSKLMYDIISELITNLEEKQIELLLLTFRTVGFNLRKDNPIALKNLILKVQELVNNIKDQDNSSRVKFMLEMLMAIKNNNMSKIPKYNPELVEKLRKSLKVFIRKGNYSTELNISLQELINAEKYGRWWIVGSAWSGAAPSYPNSEKTKEDVMSNSTKFNHKLLDLARKQRMNTDVRRNIFCILMSSEDFLEAFEKLIKLKLKGSVEREIMNVLLHCALQEKDSNPYYMYLANKFCTFDRKYQIMLQCALWDKIKELQNLLPVQLKNLAKFTGNIILEKGLPISILKVIQFSDLDKPTIKFMRQVLLTILSSDDRSAALAVFKRISDSLKLRLFRESLRLFLQHFVLKKMKNLSEKDTVRLTEMVQIVENSLTSFDGGTEF
ncbi:hypothetical protein RUM44_010553 [Polyplax serrata]|uniref:MI domain-containing protein n=1 Tax=Polyplax serrata TaxID=468196 RepID=A0ABR1AWH8_POLSC